MRMLYIKEGKIRRGWHGEADRYGKRNRKKEHAKACRGVREGKKKSMETSCSIGEVFSRLDHAQVCNLQGSFGKKPHARFGTLPRGGSFAHSI